MKTRTASAGLTQRELATVLAALRNWQTDFLDPDGLPVPPGKSMDFIKSEFAEHFCDIEPLTADEIDELCERLNCRDQGNAEPTESCTGSRASDVPDKYAQWRPTCPRCGGDGLIVKVVTLSATGQRHFPESRLQADGFVVNGPDDLKDHSTEEEIVACPKCLAIMKLEELSID